MLVFGGYLVVEESDSMACAKGGVHDYHWNYVLQKQVCSKCGHIAEYQPVPNYGELLIKYEELLKQCLDLAEDEISLNEFIILIANLSSPSP